MRLNVSMLGRRVSDGGDPVHDRPKDAEVAAEGVFVILQACLGISSHDRRNAYCWRDRRRQESSTGRYHRLRPVTELAGSGSDFPGPRPCLPLARMLRTDAAIA
jgi:hypothetical protein